MSTPHPPVAARIPHRYTRHGITIDDPYAWLRDPGYPDVTDQQVLDYLIGLLGSVWAMLSIPKAGAVNPEMEEKLSDRAIIGAIAEYLPAKDLATKETFLLTTAAVILLTLVYRLIENYLLGWICERICSCRKCCCRHRAGRASRQSQRPGGAHREPASAVQWIAARQSPGVLGCSALNSRD